MFQAPKQCQRNAKFVRWADEHEGLLRFLFGVTSHCIVLAAVNAWQKCSIWFWLKVISILWHGHMCRVSLSSWQIEFSSFFMYFFVSLSFVCRTTACEDHQHTPNKECFFIAWREKREKVIHFQRWFDFVNEWQRLEWIGERQADKTAWLRNEATIKASVMIKPESRKNCCICSLTHFVFDRRKWLFSLSRV